MENPAKPFDEQSRRMATSMSQRRVQGALAIAHSIESDTDQKARLKAQACRACHYFPVLAGQAFTRQPCGACHVMQEYSSTRTSVVCVPCATAHKACARCGAEMD